MTSTTHTPTAEQPEPTSVIDDMLDLDDFLASEVRRAERLVPLYTKPHLEAEIDALEQELGRLTDHSAKSEPAEASVGDTAVGEGRTAEDVAQEIEAKRREYSASAKWIRIRQLTSDNWMEFETKWKDALSTKGPYPPDMWDDLISKSVSEPTMSIAKVKQLRAKIGHPPMHQLALDCWELNTKAGVSVPFSQLSSAVLAPRQRGNS